MKYVDGYVIVLPQSNLDAYKAIAKKAGALWMEHGALEFIESVGEDLENPMCGTFPQLLESKEGDSVLFSFVVYKSRAHRDRVNKKVMEDPRMKDMCDPENMPFQMNKMHYGGFDVLVEGKPVATAPAKSKKTALKKKAVRKKAKTAKKSKAKARR